jgi:hypothetical protein
MSAICAQRTAGVDVERSLRIAAAVVAVVSKAIVRRGSQSTRGGRTFIPIRADSPYFAARPRIFRVPGLFHIAAVIGM